MVTNIKELELIKKIQGEVNRELKDEVFCTLERYKSLIIHKIEKGIIKRNRINLLDAECENKEDEMIYKIWLYFKEWFSSNKTTFTIQPEYGFVDSEGRFSITSELFKIILQECKTTIPKKKVLSWLAREQYIEVFFDTKGKKRFSMVRYIKETGEYMRVIIFNMKKE